MISYKVFKIGKKANINPRGSKFQILIFYTGDNINDIEDAIKSVNIGNLQIRPNNLIKATKNKQKSDFVKFVNGQGDEDFIYVSTGDLVAIAQREIYVFNKDYCDAYLDIDWKKNIIKLQDEK